MAQVLGILNVCLLGLPSNEGLHTFLRGVASSVIYYDPYIMSRSTLDSICLVAIFFISARLGMLTGLRA